MRARRGRCLLLLMLAVVIAPACRSAQRDEPDLSELPSLKEIASNVTSPKPPEDAVLHPGPRANALVERFDVPFGASVADAWSHVDEASLPDITRQAWRANGLRIGTIKYTDLKKFREAMPEPLAVHRARIIGTRQPTALRTTSRLEQAITIDLSAASSGGRDRRQLKNGRLRLVARMQPAGRGQVQFDVMPHHQRRRLSITPTDPQRNELAGRVYNELGISFNLSKRKLLVIGLYRPSTESAAPSNGDTSTGNQTGQSGDASDAPDRLKQLESREIERRLKPSQSQNTNNTPNASDANADASDESSSDAQQSDATVSVRALPHHLGRALMATQRAGRPVQLLMVISAEPLRDRQRAEREPRPRTQPVNQ